MYHRWLYILSIMLYDKLPIFKHLYELNKHVFPMTQRFHKGYRYSLWEKMNWTALELLTYIYQAQIDGGNKIIHIMKMRMYNEQLMLMIRLAKDFKQLSDRDYLLLIPLVDEIGRQLTSWNQKISWKIW